MGGQSRNLTIQLMRNMIRVVDFESSFTSDPVEVNIAERRFLEDVTLRPFLRGDIAKAIYARDHCSPFMERISPSQREDMLRNLDGPGLEKTTVFVRQMAGNNPQESENNGDPSESQKILTLMHKKTHNRNFVLPAYIFRQSE